MICPKSVLGFCAEGKYWTSPPGDRTRRSTPAPASTSPVKKRIVVETVDKGDDDHIDNRVGYFFDNDVHIGTVMGVREVKGESMWEVLFNNTNVFDYNLHVAQVLDAWEIWELNKDCDNDDEDDEPPPPPLPAKQCKNKPKEKKKPKAKTNKKHKKKVNNNNKWRVQLWQLWSW